MKRRDLGMAVIGAAAGVAGCSQPVTSLLVPDANAANVTVPNDAAMVEAVGLAQVQVNTVVRLYLQPRQKGYWRASVFGPSGAVEYDKTKLDDESVLQAKVLTTQKASIALIGGNGLKYVAVDFN
ncbi:MAG TPA: hypothetical protein VGG89_06555 [Candidatus Baltobacteraceae bacterium]